MNLQDTLPGAEADWYRNQDGTTVHRPGCRVPGAKIPWTDTNGWTEERMAHYVGTVNWCKRCKRCQ